MPEQPLYTEALDPETDIARALDALVRVLERQSGEFRASILLLSPDGTRLLDGAAPSLPAEYRNAIHGLQIGPGAGSCGTAAFRNDRVVVSDIQRDPLWAPYRDLVRPHGLAACWSQPIRSASGELLGTFAMYYPEPRQPTENDIAVIEAAASRAAILLERARAGVRGEHLLSGLV